MLGVTVQGTLEYGYLHSALPASPGAIRDRARTRGPCLINHRPAHSTIVVRSSGSVAKEFFVNLSLSRSQEQMRIYFKNIIDSAASGSKYPATTGQRAAVQGSRASEHGTTSRSRLSIWTGTLFRRESSVKVRFRSREETVRCARTFNHRPFHPTFRRPDPLPFRPPGQAGEKELTALSSRAGR
jgi:hypothetical protein